MLASVALFVWTVSPSWFSSVRVTWVAGAYSGPATVTVVELESFLPSSVQIAPSALQSVVSGRVMVIVPFPSGFTVMLQEMLLGLSVLWAASTDPPVMLKAWSRRVA